MDWLRFAKEWRRASAVIGTGLFCSFLTCLAGTVLNALLDRHLYAFDSSELIRRLIIGYAGSAAVVVLAFPFLGAGRRRRETGDGA